MLVVCGCGVVLFCVVWCGLAMRENSSVCRFKTPPCVHGKRPHVHCAHTALTCQRVRVPVLWLIPCLAELVRNNITVQASCHLE